MANPYHHACSSAKRWGGSPEDYQAIHDWFDASKEFMPDFRHRALRHHAQGIFECERVFGHAIQNSAGRMIPVRWIGEQHVQEDCGRIPTIQDWFEHITPKHWMGQPPINLEAGLSDIDQASNGAPEDQWQGCVGQEVGAHRGQPEPPQASRKNQGDLASGLAGLKASGVTAVTARFLGYNDDGSYVFGAIGGSDNPIGVGLEQELGKLLSGRCSAYGEGPGSVLIGRFDLIDSVFRGFSGDGDPSARLAELLGILESCGVARVVGKLRSGKFSKCKVEPAAAMSSATASQHVNWFLDRLREFALEYREEDEEAGFARNEYVLLEKGQGVLEIDMKARHVGWARTPSPAVSIYVDELATVTFTI